MDVAEWLHATHYSFDTSYRPVPIDKLVLGYPNNNKKNPFLFEKYLNYKYDQGITDNVRITISIF